MNKEHPTAEVEAVALEAYDRLDAAWLRNLAEMRFRKERGDIAERLNSIAERLDPTLSPTKESDLRAENERLRGLVELAWHDGWNTCRECVSDDEQFCLTDDVQADAWADSQMRAALQGSAA